MLEHWIRTGKVHKQVVTGVYSRGCGKCDPEALEVCGWITLSRRDAENVSLARSNRLEICSEKWNRNYYYNHIDFIWAA